MEAWDWVWQRDTGAKDIRMGKEWESEWGSLKKRQFWDWLGKDTKNELENQMEELWVEVEELWVTEKVQAVQLMRT